MGRYILLLLKIKMGRIYYLKIIVQILIEKSTYACLFVCVCVRECVVCTVCVVVKHNYIKVPKI